jgi:hypothetical protein
VDPEDLDAILESLFNEEDVDFIFGDYGIPEEIEEDKTEKLIKCSSCKGTGNVILLLTISKCIDCKGHGLVVAKTS